MSEDLQVTFQPDDEKLRELILYISLHSESDDRYGATKLNKLLFFADFLAYLHLGKPITGHEYQKLPKGPAPRQLMPIRNQMQEAGDIAISKVEFYGYTQNKVYALRGPNLNKFTAEEIDLVQRVIDLCWNKTAREISIDSHKFPGWILAEDNETIPYEVALIRTREPTPDEIEYGKELEGLALECLS